MTYSTTDDIKNILPEDALIQLTDDNGLGVIDQEKIDRAIAQADAEINAYCGRRYVIPFTTVPEIVRKMSIDIAIYHLYARRDVMPEIRGDRYKDAVKQLTDISRGFITLGVDPVPEPSGIRIHIKSSDKIFGRDNMKGF